MTIKETNKVFYAFKTKIKSYIIEKIIGVIDEFVVKFKTTNSYWQKIIFPFKESMTVLSLVKICNQK